MFNFGIKKKLDELRDFFTKESLLGKAVEPEDSKAHSCDYRHKDGIGFKIFCKGHADYQFLRATWKLHKKLYKKYPDLFPRPLRMGKMDYYVKLLWNSKKQAHESKVLEVYYFAVEHIEGTNLINMVNMYVGNIEWDDESTGLDGHLEACRLCHGSDHPFFKEYNYSDSHGHNIRILPNHDSFKIIDIDAWRIDKKKRAA